MQTSLLRLLLPVCLGLTAVHAATQTSDIQGFVQTTAPAGTDTLVSPVFGRAAVWAGAAQGVAGNWLTVAGGPAWTADRYAPGADTYYIRVLSGALQGQFLTVASNTAAALLVDSGGLDLGQIVAGDRLELVPYWTLGTLYPANRAGVSFIASTSSLSRQTELFFYDASGTGINRAPAAGYYFYNGAWRKVGSPVTSSFNAVIVPPDAYFLHRNKAAATTLTQLGRVHPGKLATLLETRPAAAQDNFVAVAWPLGLTLRQTGLAGSAGFTASASALARTDELYVYDSAQTGINRAPSATYYYYNGGWRKVGVSAATDFSDGVVLAAGGGFVVRRTAGGTTGAWIFDTNL